MASIKGSAVPIYHGKQPYLDTLHAVLDRPGIRDLPLYILAVTGEYRTGKSFLLSYFLRYLHNQNSRNWLGNENDPLIGFDHKCEIDPVTQGIKIWNQPLVVDTQKHDGSMQKIVVLLMDSQGIFCDEDKEEATRIFALTTMISSVLVFNLTHQLNTNILNYLQLFTAYAKMASNQDSNKIPFQKLMLLIRDWEKPSMSPFGSQGGNAYFQKKFQGKGHSLHETFRKIECYLMPRPGRCVENQNFNGCFRELEQDFKDHLKELTSHLFNPQHLMENSKEVTGLTIKAGDFCEYYKNCTELLDNVEDWKQPHNVLKMHVSFNSNSAKREAQKVYKEYMEKKFQETRSVMTDEQLQSIDKNARDEALKKYEHKSKFTRLNDYNLYNEEIKKLTEVLTEECRYYKEILKAERQRAEAQRQRAEAKRRQAEAEEEKKKREEAERHKAEAKRQQEMAERKQAEAIRQQKEAEAKAQKDRDAAEKAAQENKRLQEQYRQKREEAERHKAEAKRQQEIAERQQAEAIRQQKEAEARAQKDRDAVEKAAQENMRLQEQYRQEMQRQKDEAEMRERQRQRDEEERRERQRQRDDEERRRQQKQEDENRRRQQKQEDEDRRRKHKEEDKEREKGNAVVTSSNEDDDGLTKWTKDTAATMTVSTTTGAAIGSVVPVVGTAVGAGVGAAVGGVTSAVSGLIKFFK